MGAAEFEANFGGALDGAEVEVALLAALQRWVGPPGFTYLVWARRLKDPDGTRWPVEAGKEVGVPPLRTFSVVHFANEKWPEDQLPMYLAYSRGLVDPPRAEGDGTVSGRFVVVLTAIAEGRDMADSKALSRLYATAARGALMQHPGLVSDAYPDGFGGPHSDDGGLLWADHSNFQITKGVEAERNLMGVSDTFIVPVGNLLNRDLGVREPFAAPDEVPELPKTVQSHELEVVGEPGDVVQSLTDSGFFNEGG